MDQISLNNTSYMPLAKELVVRSVGLSPLDLGMSEIYFPLIVFVSVSFPNVCHMAC